jgi:hypothetical protein
LLQLCGCAGAAAVAAVATAAALITVHALQRDTSIGVEPSNTSMRSWYLLRLIRHKLHEAEEPRTLVLPRYRTCCCTIRAASPRSGCFPTPEVPLRI